MSYLGTTKAFVVEVGNDRDGWVQWGERTYDNTGTVAHAANSAELTYKRAPSIGVRVVRITTTREAL